MPSWATTPHWRWRNKAALAPISGAWSATSGACETSPSGSSQNEQQIPGTVRAPPKAPARSKDGRARGTFAHVMPRARLLLLVLSLAFVPVLARAEPHPPMMARLEYQRGVGAESCMDEAGLRIEVARRSGYDPFTPQARARLAVTVTRQGGQLLGTMQFFDDAGAPGWRRTYPVSSNDCVTLISAMGSEISYQFQPSRAVTEPVRSLLPLPPPPPSAIVNRMPSSTLILSAEHGGAQH